MDLGSHFWVLCAPATAACRHRDVVHAGCLLPGWPRRGGDEARVSWLGPSAYRGRCARGRGWGGRCWQWQPGRAAPATSADLLATIEPLCTAAAPCWGDAAPTVCRVPPPEAAPGPHPPWSHVCAAAAPRSIVFCSIHKRQNKYCSCWVSFWRQPVVLSPGLHWGPPTHPATSCTGMPNNHRLLGCCSSACRSAGHSRCRAGRRWRQPQPPAGAAGQ